MIRNDTRHNSTAFHKEIELGLKSFFLAIIAIFFFTPCLRIKKVLLRSFFFSPDDSSGKNHRVEFKMNFINKIPINFSCCEFFFSRTRFELLKMCTNTKEIRIEFNFHASVGNFHASMWNFVPVCAFYLHNFLRSFSSSESMRLMLKIFSLRFDFYAKESSGIFKSHKCRDIIKA